MIFWLLAVQSTVTVNGKDVAFDYTNTYYEESDAIKEAKLLSENDDVLSVSVHKWILNEDGSQEHADGDDSVPYDFLNKDHREWKWGVIMDKRKTKFNEFGCDKIHHIPREEIYRFMYSTEIYATKDIMGDFRMNGEVIKGIRL